MESREGYNLGGVKVTVAEAPSSYHVDPRSDNLAQVTRLSQPPLPLGSVMDGRLVKKKRGRPRKYRPYEPVAHTLLPLPIAKSPLLASSGFSLENQATSSAISASSGYITSPPATCLVSAEKPRKGRPLGSRNKPRDHAGELAACTSGGNFTPHTITVNAGEDVLRKIIELSQKGPRAVCVISAIGAISNVTLQQLSSGGTCTYEGMFDILSLSGSFTPVLVSGEAISSTIGSLSITLAEPDGNVVGGLLAGLLIAASPVQVIVGSFLPINHIKKHTHEHEVVRFVTNPVVPNYSDNPNATLSPMSPTCQTSKWPTMPMMEESKMLIDINTPLQEE